MDLRQLETFVCVAANHSFTRAAEELALTQPAVTRQIGALERELRTRLLERLGHRVELTSAGAALHRYAVEMLRLAAEAQHAVADVAGGLAGRLAVGVSSTAAAYLLPPLLRRYREASPGIELSVHTGASRRIAEMVLANTVDIGIVMDFQEQKGITTIPLTGYASVVVVYPEHPLARQKEGVPAAALAASPLIVMQAGTNLRASLDLLLAEVGVQAQVSMELDNVEAIKKMIEARLGISLLPLIAVEHEVAAGRLAALPLQGVSDVSRSIAAIHRADKYLSAALRAFLSLLQTAFA